MDVEVNTIGFMAIPNEGNGLPIPEYYALGVIIINAPTTTVAGDNFQATFDGISELPLLPGGELYNIRAFVENNNNYYYGDLINENPI